MKKVVLSIIFLLSQFALNAQKDSALELFDLDAPPETQVKILESLIHGAEQQPDSYFKLVGSGHYFGGDFG